MITGERGRQRPLPDQLAIAVHLAYPVQGNALVHTLRVHEEKGLLVARLKKQVGKESPDDDCSHPIVVTDLKDRGAKLPVPADSIQHFVDWLHAGDQFPSLI